MEIPFFEIKQSTISNGGRGLFSTTAFSQYGVISEYCGNIIEPSEIDSQPHNPFLLEKLAYIAQNYDGNLLIDPTNSPGEICPEFQSCHSLYINEPPIDRLFNALFCYNLDEKKVEIISSRALSPNEEVFLYYGQNYPRKYLLSQYCLPFDSICCFRNNTQLSLFVNDKEYNPNLIPDFDKFLLSFSEEEN